MPTHAAKLIHPSVNNKHSPKCSSTCHNKCDNKYKILEKPCIYHILKQSSIIVISDFYEEKSLDFNILQYIIIYYIVMLTIFQRSNLIIKFASISGKAIENF